VISGAALLVAVTMLAVAIASRFTDAFDNFGSDAFRRLVETDISAGVAVLMLTAVIAVSYVVGAVVVQRTFEAFIGPTPPNLKARDRDQQGARVHRRLEEVASLRSAMHDLDLERGYVKQLLEPVLRNPEDDIKALLPESKAELLFGLGFAAATSDVAREIEYRRGNRQLFLGVIPSLWTASVAGVVFAIGRSPWWMWLITFASVGVGLLATRVLLRGAGYQEQLVQRHLLRSAVLSCTQGADP
jgi:hypothetical protein